MMPFLRVCFLITLIILCSNAYAQQHSLSDDLQFAQYLSDNELYNEAIYVLQHADTINISQQQKDSLHYQLGFVQYNVKQLSSSATNLLHVSGSSDFYLKSRNFAGYDLAYLKQTDSSESVFKNIEIKDSTADELRYFELSGVALLQKDFEAYNSYKKRFTFGSYAFAEEEKKMDGLYNEFIHFKKKSPVLAGIYSAILPGAGKFYIGNKAQALGSFLPIASMALLTLEAYNRGGVKDARFITYASVFSIFYIGNIWSSTIAVKVRANDFNKAYENKVLFNMQIPLRRFYN